MQQYGTHNIFTHMVTEDFEHIGRMRPGAGCKIVNPSAGHIKRILEVFPECPRFILRDHPRSEQHSDYHNDPIATGKRHAEEAMRDWEKLYREVGSKMLGREYWFEGINEPWLDAGDRNYMPYKEWLKGTESLSETLDIYTISLVSHFHTVKEDYKKDHPELINSNTIFRIAAYQMGVGWPANLKDDEDPYWGFFRESMKVCRIYNAVSCFHAYCGSKGPLYLGKWHMFRTQNYPGGNDVAFTEQGMDELVINPETTHPDDRGFRNYISPEQCAMFIHVSYQGLVKIFGTQFKGIYGYTADGGGEWRTFYLHGGGHGASVYPHIEALDWNYTVEDLVIPPDPPDPPVSPTDSMMIWPTKGTMTQRFGENVAYYMQKYGSYGHNGIDMANVLDTPIAAAADGVVAWVDTDAGYGLYIRIYHPELDMHSFYAHLNSQMVSVGDEIKVGKQIGTMGDTGNSTGVHLHFELRMGQYYFDVSHGHSKGRFNPEVMLYWLSRGGMSE